MIEPGGEVGEYRGWLAMGVESALQLLAADGVLRRGDAARGRRAHFVAAATPSPSPGSGYTSPGLPDRGPSS